MSCYLNSLYSIATLRLKSPCAINFIMKDLGFRKVKGSILCKDHSKKSFQEEKIADKIKCEMVDLRVTRRQL